MRHNCLLWTSLGFNCPGAVLQQRKRRRGLAFEPDKGASRLPRAVPVHDMPTQRPPQLSRFIYIKVLDSIRRALKVRMPREMAEKIMNPPGFKEPHPGPFPEPNPLVVPRERRISVPIPEIAITGATMLTIMMAERRFGARAEQWVADQVAKRGTGRTSTVQKPGVTRTKPVQTTGIRMKGQTAGAGFRFNAAEDLRRRLLKSKRGGGDHDFSGILG